MKLENLKNLHGSSYCHLVCIADQSPSDIVIDREFVRGPELWLIEAWKECS